MRRTLLGGLAALALVAAACSPAVPAPSPTGTTAPAAPAKPTTAPAAASPAAGPAASPATASLSPAASPAAPPPSPVAAGSPAAAAPGPAQSMKVGYAGDPAGVLPMLIAIEQGLYARHGLDVSLYAITAGQQPMAALLGGDVQVMFVTSETVSARLSGADVQYVLAPTGAPLFYLYARPEIASVEALRGQKVGITGVGTATESAAKFVLDKHGLTAQSDVSLLALGNVGAITPALQADGVKAGIIPATLVPQTQSLGFHEISNVIQEGWKFVGSWGTVTGAFKRDHHDLLSQFIQGEIEGTALMEKDKATAKKVLGKYLRVDDDAILENIYQQYAGKFPRAPYPTEPDVQATIDFVAATQPNTASAKPADFIDRSFVQELETNGLIADAYK